jgi:four helix bundle protein
MPSQESFRDLEVWQEAMTLVEDISAVTRSFPADERFGLTAQLRRAAVSIPSNIAEGARRRGGAYRLHVEIALGSQGEIEVQIELARRLDMCDASAYERLTQRVSRIGRMLHGLRASIH